MKSLAQYIEEKLGLNGLGVSPGFYDLSSMLEERIDEALSKSYSIEKLINKLSTHYNIPKNQFELYKYKDGEAHPFKIPDHYIENLDDEWLLKTLLYYGYYISVHDIRKKTIDIEPIYTKNITDKIYDDCNGIIYVMIHKDVYYNKMKRKKYIDPDNDIKFMNLLKKVDHYRKNGFPYRDIQKDLFKLKGKDPYRMITISSRKVTSRRYFFAAPDEHKLKDAFYEIKKQINADIIDDYIIVKIDLKRAGYNVTCYRDEYNKLNGNEGFYVLYINALFGFDMVDEVIKANEFIEQLEK